MVFTLPRVGADEGDGGTREWDEAEEASLRRLIRLELELGWLVLLFRLGTGTAEGGFIGGRERVEGSGEAILGGGEEEWLSSLGCVVENGCVGYPAVLM